MASEIQKSHIQEAKKSAEAASVIGQRAEKLKYVNDAGKRYAEDVVLHVEAAQQAAKYAATTWIMADHWRREAAKELILVSKAEKQITTTNPVYVHLDCSYVRTGHIYTV
jgi:hypothetical protein